MKINKMPKSKNVIEKTFSNWRSKGDREMPESNKMQKTDRSRTREFSKEMSGLLPQGPLPGEKNVTKIYRKESPEVVSKGILKESAERAKNWLKNAKRKVY